LNGRAAKNVAINYFLEKLMIAESKIETMQTTHARTPRAHYYPKSPSQLHCGAGS